MRIENRSLTWTLMPLFLAGVLCGSWEVVYHQQRICAVNGSSVVIPCSFYYPDNWTVKRLIWFHVKDSYLSLIIYRNTTFQYIGDRHHNCSLKIHQVKHNDAGKYIFRFGATSNSKRDRWTGKVGSTLKVVDLNVSNGNRTMKEGEAVNLTCINGCDGGNFLSAFTWFKNGERINEGPVLYLSNVTSTDSGNYACSLKKHTATTSGVVNVDVEYGPKNTSVSVWPSTEVDAGSNITLTCSSHANPPVENYTWFKIDDDDIMDVGHQPVFVPGDGGQYLCSATNKHGSQNSSVFLTLNMKSHWATFIRDILIIIATVAVLLIVITVIAVRRRHRRRTWTTEAVNEDDIQNTDYVNWLTCDNNQSQEGNQWEGGTAEVVYTTVYFQRRMSNMEQPMDSHTDDYNVIYITV